MHFTIIIYRFSNCFSNIQWILQLNVVVETHCVQRFVQSVLYPRRYCCRKWKEDINNYDFYGYFRSDLVYLVRNSTLLLYNYQIHNGARVYTYYYCWLSVVTSGSDVPRSESQTHCVYKHDNIAQNTNLGEQTASVNTRTQKWRTKMTVLVVYPMVSSWFFTDRDSYVVRKSRKRYT